MFFFNKYCFINLMTFIFLQKSLAYLVMNKKEIYSFTCLNDPLYISNDKKFIQKQEHKINRTNQNPYHRLPLQIPLFSLPS